MSIILHLVNTKQRKVKFNSHDYDVCSDYKEIYLKKDAERKLIKNVKIVIFIIFNFLLDFRPPKRIFMKKG